MGGLTDYTHAMVLDALFGRAGFDPPESWWVGLSQASANRSGQVAEPAAGDYARAELPNDGGAWPPAIAGTKGNALGVGFDPASDWGLVRSLFLADAPEGGNVVAVADLGAPVRVTPRADGVPYRVRPGALVIEGR